MEWSKKNFNMISLTQFCLTLISCYKISAFWLQIEIVSCEKLLYDIDNDDMLSW